MAFKEPTPQEVRDEKLYAQWGLTDEEYSMISEEILGRLPNYTEAGLFAVMWSEHCSYKNTKPILKKFPTTGAQVLMGPGEGAGVVDIGDGLAVVFKAESHNHPSAVEPYEGAATGVGGIIRDIFSMGARPIAILDSLRFGELDSNRTKYLLEEIVAGIAGYGNCIGIPTIGGETSFDPCYKGNPLVNAMCVGIIEQKNIQKGQAKGTGNSILYVGAKTGRDGIHGATFASEEFNDEQESQRSAVQVGDPFMEKLLMEACLELISDYQDALVGIQDMGAAGLVSSSSEMASKARSGLILNLDKVPQREKEMTAYEMMLSESQERMLLCIKKGQEDRVIQLFKKYDLDAVVIGQVTEGNQYQLYHQGQLVADVPVDALAENAPTYYKEIKEPERLSLYEKMEDYYPLATDAQDTLKKLLATASLASKKSIYETYDSMVRTSTVVGPGSDAAVLRIRGTKKALAMTTDCNSRYLYLNPERGGAIAVAEAARNIVSSGAVPLAITDCLNFGNPDKPEIFWELSKAADGISQACRILNTPVISGNVSMYNESNGEAIYPTPMIGMVGLIENIDHITTNRFKQAGDVVYLIGETRSDFNGSELQKLELGRIEGQLMEFDLAEEKNRQDLVLEAIQSGFVSSCHDLSEGGLGIALAESLFDTSLGANIHFKEEGMLLFSETQSRYLISVRPENKEAFENIFKEKAQELGVVTEAPSLIIEAKDQQITCSVEELQTIWEEAIPCLLKQEV